MLELAYNSYRIIIVYLRFSNFRGLNAIIEFEYIRYENKQSLYLKIICN